MISLVHPDTIAEHLATLGEADNAKDWLAVATIKLAPFDNEDDLNAIAARDGDLLARTDDTTIVLVGNRTPDAQNLAMELHHRIAAAGIDPVPPIGVCKYDPDLLGSPADMTGAAETARKAAEAAHMLYVSFDAASTT